MRQTIFYHVPQLGGIGIIRVIHCDDKPTTADVKPTTAKEQPMVQSISPIYLSISQVAP